MHSSPSFPRARRARRAGPLLALLTLLAIPLAGCGGYMDRVHRRELVEALGVRVPSGALDSDSALSRALRVQLLGDVPVGSDTTAARAYLARLPRSARTSGPYAARRSAGPPFRWESIVALRVADRHRWFEVGWCAWDYQLTFVLDADERVADAALERIGTCL